MEAGAGRSSYIPESELRDVPDPGSKVVSIWMGAISSSLESYLGHYLSDFESFAMSDSRGAYEAAKDTSDVP